ncbi:non-ribosomal peptide synthetase [Ruminiclostridium cellulolyticum]|uniref:Amino acid adenylation domain protein n=1 Tax=Ruminiclostridium cellulolyticum (strain ATCC 35319 / DSM 5812 / JCM 6584 / H10) TaxID=394503 RepID=B8I5C9_RUMCH|nr:non-ribosomal peptide synthetase [Ruminiclostridium cellulolyticum]ACL76665.1 amino acid adenylation domain protein [Ruminiclostridium cellulolyticum H10]
MSVMQFLSRLRNMGVNLWLDKDDLKYQAPKGVVNKTLLAEISQNKHEIIEFLKKLKIETSSNNERIPQAPRDGITEFPLSYSQQSMWFYDQLIKGNPAFNISNAVKITGKLDTAAIENAINELVKRHEALRTTFISNNEGNPVQVINPQFKAQLCTTYVDYSADESRFKDLLKEEARGVFNLETGPLFRFHLFILSEEEYILTMVIHHIISDGWSNTVLVGELFTLYKDSVQGVEQVLPLPPVQFADYAYWEKNRLRGELLENLLNYWKTQLANTGTLKLPLDRERSAVRSFEGGYEAVEISPELTKKIDIICKSKNVTQFILILAAFKTLLYIYSGQQDICVGTVVANRNRKEIERAIGFFMNTLALRTRIDGESCFTEILEREKKTTYDAFTYQELPFDKMVEELKPPREDGVNPFFQVMFILQNTQKVELELPGVKMKPIEIESGMAPFDLRLQLTESHEGLKGGFDYNLSIFDPATIRSLARHLITTLECIVQNPEQKIIQLPIFTPDEKRDIKNKFRPTNEEKLKIAVAATFTAEPVEDYINWWCKQFGIKTEVAFAPYNQIFQQILDETSLISLNNGANVLLVRFEDWLRNDMSGDAEQLEKLEKNFSDLVNALKSKTKGIPYFAGVLPVCRYSNISQRVSEFIEDMNCRWKMVLEEMENVYVMDCRFLNEHYAIDVVFDPLKDTEAHMPFSDTFFSALGTVVARKICAWRKQNFKVIVLDCDNTLWKGVCGEEGTQGVIINEPFKRMQGFMLKRYREGMLLAVCSKNNEADVWDVFENNKGMLLKKEHFIAWRINWRSKADNIKEIADELNLGIDSFIFIDDSPVECSEVMMKLPEVLTLNLPEDEAQIPGYLKHVWAFDRFKVTAEDAQRTQMYLAEKERKQIQDSVQSLDGFIKGLELKMSMNPVEDSQYIRAAQLTHRTNQFNLSTIRRTEEELRQLTSLPGFRCHVIEVSDRFGDYGLVGVIISKESGSKLFIDTFLLSCRVLGRRIEDAILVGLKKLCIKTGTKVLEAEFRPTEKNIPFKNFLNNSGWKSIEEGNELSRFQLDIEAISDNENLVECYFNSKFEVSVKSPEVVKSKHEPVHIKQEEKETSVNNGWKVLSVNRENLLHKAYLLALENAFGKSLTALPVHRTGTGAKAVATKNEEYKAPCNKTEKILVEIWQEILGVENIGVNDDFFRLGGHSLTAVSIISRLRDRFHKYIPLQWIIENRTIGQLGKLIGEIEETDNSDDEQDHISMVSDETKEYPLSFSQQSMWFYDQLNKGNAVFNLSSAVRISGRLNIEILKQTLENAVMSHEALRTTFKNIDGIPVQVINDSVAVEINKIDLTHLNKNNEEEIKNHLKQEARFIFNLEKGPLFRFCLFFLNGNEYIFSMTTHHIVSDGWSNTIIVEEFLRHYTQFAEGQNIEIKPLPIRFADYAVWERNRFTGERLDKLMGYWKKQLENPTTLELPTDKARPKTRTYEGGFESIAIPEALVPELKKLCNNQGVTMFMLILAAFQTLLHRYSGQNDIFTGTVVANRNRAEIENTVGPFINTLVLKTNFDENPDFLCLLAKVKKTTLEAYEHQELPFDKMLEEMRLERDLSRAPLFQVMFILHNNKKAELELDGMRITEIDVASDMAPFDLRLQLTETEKGIKGGFDYNISLFETETVKAISMHLIKLIESIVQKPTEKVSGLEYITETEKRQILTEFNNTDADFPEEKVIYQYLEEQAEKESENIAVILENKKLSYVELNDRANCLARLLQKNGVGRESIVALMMERSLEMITAIMAVQKAGGAYLPVDPHFPAERIDYILKDSDTGILLTHKEFGDLKIPQNIKKINLDLIDLSHGEKSNLPLIATSENIAYVIYTSGSTGKPKGTLIEHRSLVNRLNWMQKKYPLNRDDIILQKTPYTFDVSVWELFWWSIAGAKVCFLEPGAEKDPGKIVEAIEKNNITVIHFVPSMLGVFLEYLNQTGEVSRVAGLKQVFASGEALTPSQVKAFRSLLSKNETRLANLYGPTEATIDVSYFDCDTEDELDSIPIGKPIDNTKLLIMDKNMQLQPVGVTGELCIGGNCLAREYLNKPEMTDEKFIPNPYKPNERLYRTGDLAKWRRDGNIEYLGRIDFQVKIRGLRIELGEIEKQLTAHPDVKECVVVAWKKGEGDIHLVAYVVCENSMQAEQGGIQSFLEKSLPDYMVPRIYVFLEMMPLSPNGKIDRKSLPAPVVSTDRAYEAPRNGTEKLLADIWKKILSLDRIGINDNFFEIGGDSLKAMETIIHLKKQGMQLEIKDLFEGQTIRNLGKCIRNSVNRDKEVPVTGEIGLLPTQKGFFRKTRTEITHWNISVMLYRKDRFDENIIKKAFTRIVEQHDALRINFRIDGEKITQFNRGIDGELFEISIFDCIADKDDTTNMDDVAYALHRSMNLTEGPLVKLALFRRFDGDHLLLVIHHLLCDGLSLMTILEDAATVYNQLQRNEPTILPPKTSSLKEWSERIYDYCNSSEFLKEINYWGKVENIPVAQLPKDTAFNEERHKHDVAINETLLFDNETRVLMKNVNQRFDTDIKDLLATAFGAAVKEWTESDNILIDYKIHGRENIFDGIDVSRTVGWFATEFPAVLDMSQLEDLQAQILSIRDMFRNVPGRGLGYETLREITLPENKKELKLNLCPEILFNYSGDFAGRTNEDFQGFGISSLYKNLNESPESERKYTLIIELMILDGNLNVTLHYNKHQYYESTMTGLLNKFKKYLYKITDLGKKINSERRGKLYE